MSLIMLAPLLGGAVGPAIGGAIAETVGWRQTLWVSVFLATTCEILFFLLLRETYKVPILQKRAERMRRESNNLSLKCAYEEEGGENGGKAMWWFALRAAISRPVVVLMGSSVLQIMSFYGALVFAFFYILATTLPGMLSEIYGFSPSLTGLAFLAFSTSISTPFLRSLIYPRELNLQVTNLLPQAAVQVSGSFFATHISTASMYL